MTKKGSLNLSINAIVVLILAITMLGIGLMFMRNMLGGTMDQLSDVSDEIKDQMIEEIRSSNSKLTFDKEDFDIKRSESKSYYYGVLNQLETSSSFYVAFGCDGAMDTTANHANDIKFDYLTNTIPLERNDVDVQKVDIKIAPNAVQTSYRCFVKIGADSADGSYAQKYFYVTVK